MSVAETWHDIKQICTEFLFKNMAENNLNSLLDTAWGWVGGTLL